MFYRKSDPSACGSQRRAKHPSTVGDHFFSRELPHAPYKSASRFLRLTRALSCGVSLGAVLAGNCLRAETPPTLRQALNDFNANQPAQTLPAESSVTYQVEQTVTLNDITPGTKLVRIWVAIPSDEAHQQLLDFQVDSVPGDWQVVEDQQRRGTFLRVGVREPKSESLDCRVHFSIRREPTFVVLDSSAAGPLTDGLRNMLAEYLVKDAPHMEVTEAIQKIADEACGEEQNIARQATALLKHVANTVDHYSYARNPDMPTCGVGDAGKCLAQGGGCCTDLNSLFIALARARGIPARLNMGYRLQEKNAGKLVDPGYRCWVEYYVPNYGWISADIVEADTPGGLGPRRWFTGLTARRVWLNQGREFQLSDDQSIPRVNHMSIAYAEIDGVPARLLPSGDLKPQISRKVLFTEIEPAASDAGAEHSPARP